MILQLLCWLFALELASFSYSQYVIADAVAPFTIVCLFFISPELPRIITVFFILANAKNSKVLIIAYQ